MRSGDRRNRLHGVSRTKVIEDRLSLILATTVFDASAPKLANPHFSYIRGIIPCHIQDVWHEDVPR